MAAGPTKPASSELRKPCSTIQPADANKRFVTIHCSVYKKRGRMGDMNWMIEQKRFDDCLFIFNENEEAFKSKLDVAGFGNACIRPWRWTTPPRAAGIPTGAKGGGYQSLDAKVYKLTAKQMIDRAVRTIKKIVRANTHILRIFYSGDKKGNLGCGVFRFGEDVNHYIVESLKQLSSVPFPAATSASSTAAPADNQGSAALS